MQNNVASFFLIHDNLALLLYGLLISTNSDDQMNIGEHFLYLLKHFGVTDMEHVKDAICVNPYWVVRVMAFRDPID